MIIAIKNPIYLILINWMMILVGCLGIPLILVDIGVSPSQQSIISFFTMNFNIFGGQIDPWVYSICWLVSMGFFSIIVKPDWKIPLYTIGTELFIYLFAIMLMNKNSPNSYNLLKMNLLGGFGLTCAILLLLYIPVSLRILFRKKKHKKQLITQELHLISKCPHCGTEYQSNPKICYKCSKPM
ncbi:MAG: hypothetical protein JW776_09580 [Candidatus Lokiarchaeota archaeon]|nr:hypothetical protein [Candidatus Lokiarchaeota archaeon]